MAMVVELMDMCSQLHCLPRPGGLMEQDARLMYLFNVGYGAQARAQIRAQKRAEAEAEAARNRR